jgi:hypothetical protein
MPTFPDQSKSHLVQALIHVLRGRSYQEIRQRMYDNAPGTPWWTACKTELDIRNGERLATAAVDSARLADKMKVCAENLVTSTDKLVQSTNELVELLKGARESARRMEIATYVIIGVAILQVFYIIFQTAAKH